MSKQAFLIGNPNAGKTTLFNSLTGRTLKTGNRAGVTVGKACAALKKSDVILADLPGVYSLSPFSPDEQAAVNELTSSTFVPINVVEAATLKRGLFTTLSLKSRGLRPIVFLSMRKNAEQKGMFIDVKKLSSELELPVTDDEEELVRLVNSSRPQKTTEKASSFYRSPEEIYEKISRITDSCVTIVEKPSITEKIDGFLFKPFICLPVFILFICLLFFLTFSVGSFFDLFFDALSIRKRVQNAVLSLGLSPIGESLLLDGVVSGVGSVLGFLPELFTLFFLFSLVEGSGYTSRVALAFDSFFSFFGLSGKSIVPLLLGSSCSVPAIAATKTIKESVEREKTVLLVPFVPCSAKLPIIALFAGFFFENHAFLATVFVYFLSVVTIIAIALLTKDRKAEPSIFPELPSYSLPSIRQALKDAIKQSAAFFKKTGTVIFSASIVVWFLSSFSLSLSFGVPQNESVLAAIGGLLSPILYPVLGKLSWEATVAALLGFLAKEEVVSAMSVLATSQPVFESAAFSFFTTPSAVAFLLFNLFSSPCVAAVSAIKRELGLTKTALSLLLQNLFAITLSSFVRLIITLLLV